MGIKVSHVVRENNPDQAERKVYGGNPQGSIIKRSWIQDSPHPEKGAPKNY